MDEYTPLSSQPPEKKEPPKAIKLITSIGFSFLFYCLLFVILWVVGVATKGENNIVFGSLPTIPMVLASLFAGFCLIYIMDEKNYIINKIKNFL